MNSFLYRIAKVFLEHHDVGIGDYTFVFPNRRAGLFFQRYISQLAGKPIFSPRIMTINECFSTVSTWQTADKLSMLFRLYRIYLEHSKSEESFDSFVFWGEMLLSDFDDVDKYHVDASQLFTNITELKQIDELFNVFSDNQIEAIRQFWSSFVPVTEGKTSEEFINTWKILYPIYQQFRVELIAENTATEGMICRDVTDRLKKKEEIAFFDEARFVFIGFNALNPSEKTLFEELQKRGIADFYWDYEADELRDPNNHASRFYAKNCHVFPSHFNIEPVVESLHNKHIELIAVPSAVGQVKQAYAILQQLIPDELPNTNTNQPKSINTAVVLPDESLLLPLLHSIPMQIDKINVTMGFPLKSTPVSGLIDHVFELQRRMSTSNERISFYHASVLNILNHQYVSLICANEANDIMRQMAKNNWIYVDERELKSTDLLASIFTPQTDTKNFLRYLLTIFETLQSSLQIASTPELNFRLESDFIYQYYVTIKRMADVLNTEQQQVDMTIDTLVRLIRQLTASISIPFIGEPLDGLQVMGVLETRGLDFENLIFTSFNEGVFPKKSNPNSFIPYNLRRGFELPTAEHQDAILAYNFYRLMHRAKNIFFLYDSRSDASQTGEVSRFLHQLQYHYGVNFKRVNISYDIGISTAEPIAIQKTPELMVKLTRFLSPDEFMPSLSASSLDTYLTCPLQFYLTKVEKIEQAEEVKETIEADVFGQLFHKVMELIYQSYEGKIVQVSDFDALLKDPLSIDKLILHAFSVVYFKKKNNAIVQLEGNNLLIASVIRKYIIQVLKIDKKYAPFKYVKSEAALSIKFPIFDGTKQVNFKGFIDRIDEKDGCLRIIDYKTGTGLLQFKSLEEVFDKEIEKRPKFVLQTFLYGILYKEKALGRRIAAGIYLMRDIFKDNFEMHLNYKPAQGESELVTDFTVFEDDFKALLTTCLEEIFNPEVPFSQTKNTKNCQYCSYVSVCNR